MAEAEYSKGVAERQTRDSGLGTRRSALGVGPATQLARRLVRRSFSEGGSAKREGGYSVAGVPSVFLFATLDTKGREAAFVRDLLRSWGIEVTLVDVGALGEPLVSADVPRSRIFELAGTSLAAVRDRSDRGEAVTAAALGAARLAAE